MRIKNVIGDNSPEMFENLQGGKLLANNMWLDMRNYYVL